ncbi:MAG: outer membrane beta-barrel protein [Bacteroidales bacterium]|nr:outer membrane beta-barrel protein [Bacteroidales bacterium]
MRKIRIILLFVVALMASGSAAVAAPPSDWSRLVKEASWLQYGFRLGVNISLESKYSETDKLDKLLSAEFGAFARFGKIVYGEIGFGYMFHKGTYETAILPAAGTERVESRFLQIPIKAVAYLPVSNKVAFLPNFGVAYQPLIHVTKNSIGYDKSSINPHSFIFMAGTGLKIHFVTIDLAYKKNLTSFFKDRKSAKPSFFSIMLGFQF